MFSYIKFLNSIEHTLTLNHEVIHLLTVTDVCVHEYICLRSSMIIGILATVFHVCCV